MDTTLKDRLKKIKKDKNWTTTQLAKALDVSSGNMSAILSGRKGIGRVVLHKLLTNFDGFEEPIIEYLKGGDYVLKPQNTGVDYCVRCKIRVGKKSFVEPSSKTWKFNGRKFILCLSCFNDVKNVKNKEDFSKPDRQLEWYKK